MPHDPVAPDRTKLDALLREAVAAYKAMTPEQQEAMHAEQRASWVRSCVGIRPKFKWVNGVKVYETYADYCEG